jgi:hypothetical protein
MVASASGESRCIEIHWLAGNPCRSPQGKTRAALNRGAGKPVRRKVACAIIADFATICRFCHYYAIITQFRNSEAAPGKNGGRRGKTGQNWVKLAKNIFCANKVISTEGQVNKLLGGRLRVGKGREARSPPSLPWLPWC